MRGGLGENGRLALAGLAACLLLLGAAASSSAAAAAEKGSLGGGLFGETGTQVEITVGKSPHIVLKLSTSGQRVTLEATRGSQSVSYEVAGAVSGRGVRANFDRAGKVDLRFEPSGPPRSVEHIPFCKGKDGSVATGTFVGTFRFTGFDRFVHFQASRVRGTVSRSPPLHCHLPGGPHKHPQQPEGKQEEEDQTVALAAARGCGRFGFVAVADRDPTKPLRLFLAISRERVGRVRVSRSVLLFTERPGFFSFDPALTSATVAPPPPFHGTATFRRGVGGAPSTWSGSLTVSFLDGRQSLTGHGIEAVLEEIGAGGGGSTSESKCESGHVHVQTITRPIP